MIHMAFAFSEDRVMDKNQTHLWVGWVMGWGQI